MYFITTVNPDDYRCVGYVSSLDEAIRIVENNIGDLYEEGYYPYAVIENIPEGIYKYDQNPIWFKFDDRKYKYKRVDERPSYIDNHFVGFGIG